MAIIRNTAAMRLKGSVGNTTYYTQGGRQLARVSQNSSNYGETARRSPAQQRRRVMWANLVNFYKVSANWMHGAFESKKKNETDYNKFMSVNLPSARIALTKDQAVQGAVVYDNFIISQGTLRSIELTRITEGIVTSLDLFLSTAEIQAATIGFFSQRLIGRNPWLTNGCQLSFIIYSLNFDRQNNPYLSMSREELCIDTTSEQPMSELPITEHLYGTGARLGWKDVSEDDYVAVILSDSTDGTLKVSSQRLVPGDTETVESFTTEAKIQAAMESYGVDPTYFLESGYE